MVTGTVSVVDTAPDGCAAPHRPIPTVLHHARPQLPSSPPNSQMRVHNASPLGRGCKRTDVLVAAQITPSEPHVSFLYFCCQVSASAVETAMIAAYDKGLLAPHSISFDRVVLPACDRRCSSAAQGSAARAVSV
jgi:hypothetical protein